MPGTMNLGFIGDSITEGGAYPGVTPVTTQCAALVATGLDWTVTPTNRGLQGSSSGQWVSGGGTLIAAKAAFASASVTDVSVMLGANDCHVSVSASTYGTNMASICNDLVATGYKVWLHYPTYCYWDTGLPSAPLLVAYQAQIDSLCDGRTVFRGDTTAYAAFAANPQYIPDGVHPDDDGISTLAAAWAAAIVAAWLPRLRRPALRFSGDRMRVR